MVLSIWRQGVIFNVIARGPLGCVLEHAKPEVSEKATADFADVVVEPQENYTTFEVLRDIFRNCIVLDTRLSPTAMIFPPIWCLQNRLWEVLVATFLVYGITLAVHWVLFIIAYVVLAIYFKKAHLVLRRSFAMMRGGIFGWCGSQPNWRRSACVGSSTPNRSSFPISSVLR